MPAAAADEAEAQPSRAASNGSGVRGATVRFEAGAVAGIGDGDGASLQELAKKSLAELAQLPERIAESLAAWTTGLEVAAAAGGACAPAPAAAGALGADGGPAGRGRGPTVVIPEREAFSRLLLHRNAIQDHLPDAYMAALQRLRQQLAERPQQQLEGGEPPPPPPQQQQ